ncbi:hypothetical protein H8958_013889 [Nasalis larvatus]
MLLPWSGGHGCQAQWTGCKSVHYNLVFLLDTSSSVGKEDFEKVQRWVANQVDTFEVGPDCMGVVRSFDLPNVAFVLGILGSREEVKAATCRCPRDCAYKQVAILLTDGPSQDLVLDATAAAHHAGIRIFTVDMGEAFKEELEEIALEPKSTHVFHVSDLNAIDKIQGKLWRCLCENVLCPSVRVEEIALSTPMQEPRKSQEQQKQQTF